VARLASNPPPKPVDYNAASTLHSSSNHEHRADTVPLSQLSNFVMKPISHELLEESLSLGNPLLGVTEGCTDSVATSINAWMIMQ